MTTSLNLTSAGTRTRLAKLDDLHAANRVLALRLANLAKWRAFALGVASAVSAAGGAIAVLLLGRHF